MWCHIAEEWRLISTLCYGVMSEMPSKVLVCSVCVWAGDSCEICYSHSCVTDDQSFQKCDTLSDSSGLLDPWRWGHHSLLKCWEPLNQQHSVTFQKMWSLRLYLLNCWRDSSLMVYCNETKLFVACMHSVPETCGCLQQADSSVSFELIFFKLFQPNTGLANIFEGTCPNCG